MASSDRKSASSRVVCEACPVSRALDVIGGKWKLQILWALQEKTFRFGELKRALGSVSEKILIQQLKELTDDGMVNRQQFPQVPPRVEYSLTRRGQSLLPLLQDLNQWSQKHLMRSAASSVDFDRPTSP